MSERSRVILLVEDEPLIAAFERRVLESDGYEVSVAQTGEQALAAISNSPKPDLILMDIDLGPGIDGTEAAQRILQEHDIPIVFLSSHTEKEYTKRAEQISSYGYIVKHTGDTVLLASVKMAFKLFEAHRALSESEAELRESQQLALTGRWDYYHRDECLRWASMIYRIFELEEGAYEPSYEAFLLAIHPNDRSAVDTAWRQSLKDMKPYEVEHRLLMPDGRIKWVREYCRTGFDDAGNPLHSVGIVQDITDRKTTELALSAEKEYLQAILATTADGFWVITPQKQISEVNDAYCRMSGYSKDELQSMAIGDIDAVEEPQETAERVQRIMRSGSETFETKHRRKDGSVFDVEVTASRFDRSDGACLVCFCRDITQRKQARNELEESRNRYRVLVDRSPDIIYLFGTRSGGLFWSEATRRILGYEPQDIVRDPHLWNRSVHPEDKPLVERAIAAAVAGETFDIEYRIQAANGDWVWLRDKLIDRSEQDGEVVIQGHAEDITEQKHYQQQLSETDALLNDVLDNMLDLVAITDLQGNYLYAGKSHERLGYGVSFLIGKNVMEFVHPDDLAHVTDEFLLFLQDGNERPTEYRYRCADGAFTWLETSGRLLKNEKGHAVKILFNTRDVTERKQILTQKDTLIREFRHRIKNSIHQISGLLSMQAQSMSDPTAVAALHDARSRMNSFGVLYDQLYDTNTGGRGSLQAYLEQLVAMEAEIFPQGKQVDIQLEIEEYECATKMLSAIGTVVNELVTNAMKYAFQDHPHPRLTLTGMHRDKHYVLTVEDNGPGIREPDREQFSSGLGLTLVDALVEQMKGSIRFDNTDGMRVEIEFPVP